ncbi:MAG: UDP-N-acetylmuramoyl-tripeptide--D-alanyl-D-alanine ligase [Nitrospirae bacterium]|nr:UDP-N-acetylmuramoyl-tripeptide--D-alanyl-D-alanine ligase [Nitrospirota bacterium]
MGRLILDDIVKATRGTAHARIQPDFTGLSIDSRTIRRGELFVALEGDKFDGHDFLQEALSEGAGAIVHRHQARPFEGKTLIEVGNTLKALQDIAGYLRNKLNVPVIGVTGTNGKTTTKELIAAILRQRHEVLKTSGNLNNHIGLPLSIARMQGTETVMVLEMGSNREGDIRLLCDIARPDLAVVTNVGAAHLEGFGSIDMVRKTDLEILPYVRATAVNADDLFLMAGVGEFSGKLITYGIDNRADFQAADIILGERGSRFRLCCAGTWEIDVSLALPGKCNIANALAAASVTHEMGSGPEEIKKGLESFSGVPLRMEISEISGILVIRDVYNANPSSMEEAVKELIRLKRKRTIAVLGDMLELGTHAEKAHGELVGRLSALHVDVFIAVGSEMKKAAPAFSGACYRADDAPAARNLLLDLAREGDTILIKGSRGMQMEKVIEAGGLALKREGADAV